MVSTRYRNYGNEPRSRRPSRSAARQHRDIANASPDVPRDGGNEDEGPRIDFFDTIPITQPVLLQTDSKSVRTFLRQYSQYQTAIRVRRSQTDNVVEVSLKDLIHHDVKDFLEKIIFKKPWAQVAEEELQAHLKSCVTEGSTTTFKEKIKHIFKWNGSLSARDNVYLNFQKMQNFLSDNNIPETSYIRKTIVQAATASYPRRLRETLMSILSYDASRIPPHLTSRRTMEGDEFLPLNEDYLFLVDLTLNYIYVLQDREQYFQDRNQSRERRGFERGRHRSFTKGRFQTNNNREHVQNHLRQSFPKYNMDKFAKYPHRGNRKRFTPHRGETRRFRSFRGSNRGTARASTSRTEMNNHSGSATGNYNSRRAAINVIETAEDDRITSFHTNEPRINVVDVSYTSTDTLKAFSNGITFDILSDSGAEVNILPEHIRKKIKAQLDPLEKPMICKGFNEAETISRYTTQIPVSIECANDRVASYGILKFHVVDIDLHHALLGREFLMNQNYEPNQLIYNQFEQRKVLMIGKSHKDVTDYYQESQEEDRIYLEETESNFIEPFEHDEDAQGIVKDQLMQITKEVAELKQEHYDRLANIACHHDLFRTSVGRDPPSRLPPYKVTMKPGATPYRSPPRRYTIPQQQFIERQFGLLVRHGWYIPVIDTHWATNLVCVAKKEHGSDEYRLAVDLRPINARTLPLATSGISIEHMVHKIAGSRYFGVFDIFKGHPQIELDRESQKFFTVRLPDGRFMQPTRMAQGHTDSSSHFNSCMRTLVLKDLEENTDIMGDDIIIFAKDIPTYINALEKLFLKLDQYNLKISVKKNVWLSKSIQWCGRTFAEGSWKYADFVTEGVDNLQKPKDFKELSRLVHGLRWRAFTIPKFAQIVQPLHDLYLKLAKQTKRRNVELTEWNLEQDAAFTALKSTLKQEIKLTIPVHGTHTLLLTTDASENFWSGAVWCYLKSLDPLPDVLATIDLKPVGFVSGKFTDSSLRWSTQDKEAYAIFASVRKLDYLFDYFPFNIRTDSRNISYIFHPEKETTSKATITRVSRWAFFMSRFRFGINHIAGDENVWADMLTRHVKMTKEVKVLLIQAPQLNSSNLINMIRESQKRYFPHWAQTKDPFVYDAASDLYYKNEKIFVPEEVEVMTHLAAIAHSMGHFKLKANYQTLKSNFEFASSGKIKDVIRSLISVCHQCQLTNRTERRNVVLGTPTHTRRRNGILHMDYLYMSQSTKRYMLCLKDDFTGYCKLYACKRCSTKYVVKALLDWSSTFGIPKLIVSDRGTHFVNYCMQELCKRLQVHRHCTTAYSPKSNGTIERLNRDILRIMRCFISDQRMRTANWPNLCAAVQHSLNMTPREYLANYSPHELFTGLPRDSPFTFIVDGHMELFDTVATQEEFRHAIYALSETLRVMTVEVVPLKEKLMRKHRETASKHGHRVIDFDVGDLVLVHQQTRDKLKSKFTGPYIISAFLLQPYVYELTSLIDENQKLQAHADRLLPYNIHDVNRIEELKEQVRHDMAQYDVEAIIAHETEHGKLKRIRCKYYGIEQQDWEDAYQLYLEQPSLVKRYAVTNNIGLPEHP